MAKIIELNAPNSRLVRIPANVFALRWRIKTLGGIEISSTYLPEIRYPSIRATMLDFAGHIDALYIEGYNRFQPQEKSIFLTCPGHALAKFSYRIIQSQNSGRATTVGIEVEDIEGDRYLVLIDGTVYTEKGALNHVANNN